MTWASYKQLEVKINQTNTNNVNKTWASYKQLEEKTNQTNTDIEFIRDNFNIEFRVMLYATIST
jgi:hypothetical protein